MCRGAIVIAEHSTWHQQREMYDLLRKFKGPDPSEQAGEHEEASETSPQSDRPTGPSPALTEPSPAPTIPSQPALTDSLVVLHRTPSSAPVFCPCGTKLTCPSCGGTRSKKRRRLERDQPPRNSLDPEFEFPAGTTSASEQPVPPEDFDYLITSLSKLQEKVLSMQRRQQASRVRAATDVPSRPKPSSIPSVSHSTTPATATSTQQGGLREVLSPTSHLSPAVTATGYSDDPTAQPTSTNTPPDITLGDTSAVPPPAITTPPDATSSHPALDGVPPGLYFLPLQQGFTPFRALSYTYEQLFQASPLPVSLDGRG
ncbi:hypothetical protein B0T18DRAFT_389301 [Schizothecium vesticola]|uniref:Uncharacterized protein n=1 Tax=Schizothecium vesticola TaxID=314040 RepID=A0AA40F214_9PEZI|nr:hypothetical protein B0T18DRAFT_389301 [Schizothecium vesticola]